MTGRHTASGYDGPDQVKITVKGKGYIFRPGEITPRIARRVRQETGLSLMSVLQTMNDETEVDIDIIATICYAAALQTDPASADLEAIEESFTYADVEEVTVEIPTEEEGDPEL